MQRDFVASFVARDSKDLKKTRGCRTKAETHVKHDAGFRDEKVVGCISLNIQRSSN